jgi:hypothetical protein
MIFFTLKKETLHLISHADYVGWGCILRVKNMTIQRSIPMESSTGLYHKAIYVNKSEADCLSIDVTNSRRGISATLLTGV